MDPTPHRASDRPGFERTGALTDVAAPPHPIARGDHDHQRFETTEDLRTHAGALTSSADGPATGAGALPPMPAPVDQGERYTLGQALGQGGTGTVWSAYDNLLARQVAVKTLHIEGRTRAEHDAIAAQVLDEARAAARLSHPHIVTVHDAGIGRDGRAYIAMELLRGRDLAELLRSGWQPTLAQAVMIARRVADALGYAHSKGVIHRDIKPGNIFMVGRTRPVVLDFGLARLIHQADQLVEADVAIGSPYYAPPEQFDGSSGDARSDLYSLGVVLYEMLTGERPFGGASLDAIRASVRRGQARPPSQLVPDLPPVLEALVLQLLARDPAARPRTAGVVARELRTWLASRPDAEAADAVVTDPKVALTAAAAGLNQVHEPVAAPASPRPAPRSAWRVPGETTAATRSQANTPTSPTSGVRLPWSLVLIVLALLLAAIGLLVGRG